MPRIEVTNEPTPAPRKSGKPRAELGCYIRFIDEKTGKEVGTAKSGPFYENERRTRSSRKY